MGLGTFGGVPASIRVSSVAEFSILGIGFRLLKIGVVTNTRAVWETARGICSALSEHRSRSDRASGRERVKRDQLCFQIEVVTNYVVHIR